MDDILSRTKNGSDGFAPVVFWQEFSYTLRPIAARHGAVTSGERIATPPLVAFLLEKYLLAFQQVARSHKMTLADLRDK